MMNRKSYSGFPTSYRWRAYVTSKSPKGWLKKLTFPFLNKTQLQLNEFCYKVSLTENFQQQGSAEALARWGGKIKYILIAYFLGNICAKNCRNRTVYVKIIASCKGGTFLRHGVERCSTVESVTAKNVWLLSEGARNVWRLRPSETPVSTLALWYSVWSPDNIT